MKNQETIVAELEYLRDKVLELEELNRDYFGLFENSYDALVITDGNGKSLFINPAAERFMGMSTKEVLGRTVQELLDEGILDDSAILKVLRTGKAETVSINTSTGRTILSTAVPAFDSNGKIYRIYINLRDISELNQLRQKYQESQTLASKYLSELIELKQQTSDKLVAHSKEFKQVLETAYRIANVDSTVLVLGESGVGKDRIAHIIHESSLRNESGSFIKINCGAIPAELLESELFGYERGAFTGASKEGKVGYFEIADKGTIFLDEIGELSKKLQVKLLAVIQDQKISRVGGTKEKPVDIRIIAATNRNLEEMVRQGDFREDLFYRLNVVPILIPPLRERKEDIPFLLIHYLENFNRKYNREISLSQTAINMLCTYNWPGNIRELANLIERIVVTSQETLIKPAHLPKITFHVPKPNGR
ncbi:sigma 54-interacting transcriptional regulator [bacterium]|nr:sigma 54-interacting transcriptional regulator [bacterium]